MPRVVDRPLFVRNAEPGTLNAIMDLPLTPDTIERCSGSVADLRGRISIRAVMRDLEVLL